jgi:hypothetical protein
VQVLEHTLAVLDLVTAEPSGIGAVQSRWMAFQAHLGKPVGAGPGTSGMQREANDHEDNDIRSA